MDYSKNRIDQAANAGTLVLSTRDSQMLHRTPEGGEVELHNGSDVLLARLANRLIDLVTPMTEEEKAKAKIIPRR